MTFTHPLTAAANMVRRNDVVKAAAATVGNPGYVILKEAWGHGASDH
jgi:hypothetical protein